MMHLRKSFYLSWQAKFFGLCLEIIWYQEGLSAFYRQLVLTVCVQYDQGGGQYDQGGGQYGQYADRKEQPVPGYYNPNQYADQQYYPNGQGGRWVFRQVISCAPAWWHHPVM